MRKIIVTTLIVVLSINLGRGIDNGNFQVKESKTMSTYLCQEDEATSVLPSWIFNGDEIEG